jgi:hypothetical protein
MILFCIDGDQIKTELLDAVHEAFPNAAIYVRAFDRRAMIHLHAAPATLVIREVMESAIQMARTALGNVGLSQEAINRAEDNFRTRDAERLAVQIEGGDVRLARDRILTTADQTGESAEPG